MSEAVPIYCKNCGYTTFLEEDTVFIVSKSKLHELSISLFKIIMNEEDIRIWGFIFYSFCSNCNKPLKVYLILGRDNNNDIINVIYNNLINKQCNDKKYYLGDIETRFQLVEKNKFVELIDTNPRYFNSIWEMDKFYYDDFESKEEAISHVQNIIKNLINNYKEDYIEYAYFVDTITEEDKLKILEFKNYTHIYFASEDSDILRNEHFEKVIKCPICENKIKLNSLDKKKCPKCNEKLYRVFDGEPIE
ncbi:MAG: hypothetical protein IJQ68_07235 [Methanobrevibacter sp.]|uniref:hypothetical protein n=1 Tax=Methanobrevibacter sp. TaxID=66852 RepID=UPI0025E77B82|nr:hypothetical protein [Methanobrevibacter sp.]MBR0271764.1 hypothetical protein [Methanobrevibacter sp.]